MKAITAHALRNFVTFARGTQRVATGLTVTPIRQRKDRWRFHAKDDAKPDHADRRRRRDQCRDAGVGLIQAA
jgi:hypothetical protein